VLLFLADFRQANEVIIPLARMELPTFVVHCGRHHEFRDMDIVSRWF